MTSEKVGKKKWSKTKKGRKSLRELKDYNLVGESFISEIERSKSNNSRCHSCGKRIGKNTLRGIQRKLYKGGEGRTFMMRFVHCSDCSIKLLEERINELRLLNKLMKGRKRTRKASYQKQEDLRLKDELLNKLLDDKDKNWRTR